MNITYGITRAQAALDAATATERVGLLDTAVGHFKEALKEARKDALEESAGQLSLPIPRPAPPGPVHAVAANGLVVTPADDDDLGPGQRVADGTPPISEADAKKAHRRGRGRPKVIDDELPTETEFKAAEIAAAEAAAEPDWSTV